MSPAAEARHVGLVLVAHSRKLADGLAELASQMAPDVRILPVGGLPDGTLGTDYDAVRAALDAANRGAGVVLLYDLGSAQLTAELAVEALGDPDTAFVVDAPFVEGTVAAAVAAQGGADLDGVATAAAAAAPAELAGQPETAAPTPSAGPVERREIPLRNEVGLHARPAALLARAVSGLDAEVTVRYGETTVDAHSVLALMELGAKGGDSVLLTARGPQASQAIENVVALAERRFDE
jgi:phosphoenolpyruvate---glycerone phosphotransferase subunit DhaM